MTKPILLLDMDGPLAAFDVALWDFCQRKRIEMDIENLADPNRKYFMTENMLHTTDKKFIRLMLDKSDFFRNLPVTEGAIDGVAELQKEFDVWICTKPLDSNPTSRDDKMWWVSENFPDLYGKVIMAPNKSFVAADILLDDAPNPDYMYKSFWTPVVFSDTFNGAGSVWECLPHWTWSDPIENLLDYYYKKENNA